MTLKPSTQNNTKTTQKKQKEKIWKTHKKKPKTTQKWAFQLSVIFSSLLGGCPKFGFFDNLAQKVRTLKHYKK